MTTMMLYRWSEMLALLMGAFAPWVGRHHQLTRYRFKKWWGRSLRVQLIFAALPLLVIVVMGVSPLVWLVIVSLPSGLYGYAFGRALASFTHSPLAIFAFQMGAVGHVIFTLLLWPPMFMYSHLWGPVLATFLGQEPALDERLLWFRLGSLLYILAAWLVSRAIDLSLIQRAFLFFFAMAFCYGCNVQMGQHYGFRVSTAYLEEKMSVVVRRSGLIMHLSRAIDSRDRASIIEEHMFRLWQLRRHLGMRSSGHIKSYIFSDAAEQERFTGAVNAFAKPQLRAIFVHDVLRQRSTVAHEMVHSLAADWGGMAGISRVYGVAICTGMLEGLAQAHTPVIGPMDVHHSARALQIQGELPDFSDVLAPWDFGRISSYAAYTAAGSFLAYLQKIYGLDAVRASYPACRISEATGCPLAQLDANWSAFLRHLHVSDEEVVFAGAQLRRKIYIGKVEEHDTPATGSWQEFDTGQSGNLARMNDEREREEWAKQFREKPSS